MPPRTGEEGVPIAVAQQATNLTHPLRVRKTHTQPGAEAIGVTSGAFSVGKRALVAWCNGFLAVELEKVRAVLAGVRECAAADTCLDPFFAPEILYT